MPSIKPLIKLDLSRDELIDRAVKVNVDNSVKRLYKKSNFIKNKADEKSLTIIGATYSLNSGLVTF